MGAVQSGMLFCMLPAIRCNIVRLQNKLAFHPPLATYGLDTEEGGPSGGTLRWSGSYGHEPPPPPPGLSMRTRLVDSAGGNRVALFHILCDGAEITLLWSHGNAMDAGECVELLQHLAEQLRVNVVCYDYAGYGASTGVPSEAATYADIAAAHAYLGECGVADGQICLCGQSVGSGPATWLAERPPRSFLGLFLMSGLLSGLRVLSSAPFCSAAGFCAPQYAFACFDIYPNHRRLPHVECPVFIMHGALV